MLLLVVVVCKLLAELITTSLGDGLPRVLLRIRLLLDILDFLDHFLATILLVVVGLVGLGSLLGLRLLADGTAGSLGCTLLLSSLFLILSLVGCSLRIAGASVLGLNSRLEVLTPLRGLRNRTLRQVETLASRGLARWLLAS